MELRSHHWPVLTTGQCHSSVRVTLPPAHPWQLCMVNKIILMMSHKSHQMRFYWDARKFLSRVQNMEIPELFKFDFNWVSLHDQDINTVIIHFPITPCSADAVVVSNLHSCMNAVPEIKVQFYHGESKLWFLILWCKLQVAGEVINEVDSDSCRCKCV